MNKIRELRILKGMSQKELADRCSVHQTAVSQWENERTYPDTESLMKLSEIFDVSVDELMCGEAARSGRMTIPVFGYIRVGAPVDTVADFLDYDKISRDVSRLGEFFALKIDGNSLEPRICDGDLLIVRYQNNVKNGDVAVILVNGSEIMINKVIKKDTRTILVPLNKHHEPIVLLKKETAQAPVKIIGKVVELRGKL